jgi:hypothetical protein
MTISEPLPRVRGATVRVDLGDGSSWTWELTGPLDGVAVHSDRNRYGMHDLTEGPEHVVIPKHWPVQIGFAFALPLGGGVPARLIIGPATLWLLRYRWPEYDHDHRQIIEAADATGAAFYAGTLWKERQEPELLSVEPAPDGSAPGPMFCEGCRN